MRYRLANRYPEVPTSCYVAPSAELIGEVVLGELVSVWFGAVLRGDNARIQVGAKSNIQDGSVVHVDPDVPVEIGEEVTVGHKVMLHGCRIGDRSLIGIGSCILNHAVVGSDCIIGAHTLITEGKTIPDRALVVGSPGKVVRQLSEQEIVGLRESAASYVEKIARYQDLHCLEMD